MVQKSTPDLLRGPGVTMENKTNTKNKMKSMRLPVALVMEGAGAFPNPPW